MKISRREMRQIILDRLDGRPDISDADIYREIDKVIMENREDDYGKLQEKRELREKLFNSIRKLDLLEDYLKDDQITEIMIVGPSKIFVEKNGIVLRTEDSFFDEEEVYRLVDQIVAPTNRMVNESNPIVDCRLYDGSRVHIVVPPVALDGPVITIRKFPKDGMTMDKLLSYGEFPESFIPFISCLVKSRYNILVSGATNSGKSSLLNAMAGFIGEKERIITIEDSAELQFFQVDNLVRLETRNATVEGTHEVKMNDLIKASLRMRPDRIIVGEVRGAEAASMLQALSTGHSGSFSSIHANSCRDALRRLETMTLMGQDMPLRAIQGQIASSIEILIHLGRLRNGKRKVLEVSELAEYKEEDYIMNPLFSFHLDDTEQDGVLKLENGLIHENKLHTYGQYENYVETIRSLYSA